MNSIHHPAFRALPLVSVLLSFAVGSSAQSSSPARDPAEVRRINPRELAAAVAAGLPKYDPSSAARQNQSIDAEIDDRDADEPNNQIVRLPAYIVHGRRPPILRDRDLLTERGLGELAQRRYITRFDRLLNGHPIPIIGASLESRALAMYAEDERLQNMADLSRSARLASLVDPAGSGNLKRLADDANMRRSDFGVELGH
jgi:hypothetical protein